MNSLKLNICRACAACLGRDPTFVTWFLISNSINNSKQTPATIDDDDERLTERDFYFLLFLSANWVFFFNIKWITYCAHWSERASFNRQRSKADHDDKTLDIFQNRYYILSLKTQPQQCAWVLCMSWAKLNRFKLEVVSRHMKNIEIYCAEASTLYRSDLSLSLCNNNVLRMIVLRRHRRESTQKERRQFRSLNLCSELFYICARAQPIAIAP